MTAPTMPRVLPIPEHRILPTYRVPTRSTRVRITGHCPTCRGSAFDVEWPSDLIERTHPAHRARVLCLLCGRPVGLLAIGEVG